MHALILISFLFVVLKLAVFVFFVPNQPLPTCMFLFCPIVFVASFCVVCFACQLCVDAAWFMVDGMIIIILSSGSYFFHKHN